VVISSTSGYDHIDLEETTKKKVRVFHTPLANAQSTAELTMMLMLECARQKNSLQKMMASSDWNRRELQCVELQGKTLGIIGLGNVGSRVAKMAQAFGLKVYAYDPYKEDEHFTELRVGRLGYTEVLRISNVITYHVPSTKETYQMLNRRLFDDMHDNMIVINASRGDIINEQDLLFGLDSDLIFRAGLDVFAKEPLPKTSPLLQHPKVVTTPHIGATTNEAFAASSLLSAQKCVAFFRGQNVSDELPPEAPWWKYEFRRST
jgi:D-3-phosphoglycerate dehydrogenase